VVLWSRSGYLMGHISAIACILGSTPNQSGSLSSLGQSNSTGGMDSSLTKAYQGFEALFLRVVWICPSLMTVWIRPSSYDGMDSSLVS
jgi:hypothetical protein